MALLSRSTFSGNSGATKAPYARASTSRSDGERSRSRWTASSGRLPSWNTTSSNCGPPASVRRRHLLRSTKVLMSSSLRRRLKTALVALAVGSNGAMSGTSGLLAAADERLRLCAMGAGDASMGPEIPKVGSELARVLLCCA
eukprot:4813637-Prymnesium_polylepis.1